METSYFVKEKYRLTSKKIATMGFGRYFLVQLSVTLGRTFHTKISVKNYNAHNFPQDKLGKKIKSR